MPELTPVAGLLVTVRAPDRGASHAAALREAPGHPDQMYPDLPACGAFIFGGVNVVDGQWDCRRCQRTVVCWRPRCQTPAVWREPGVYGTYRYACETHKESTDG